MYTDPMVVVMYGIQYAISVLVRFIMCMHMCIRVLNLSNLVNGSPSQPACVVRVCHCSVYVSWFSGESNRDSCLCTISGLLSAILFKPLK